MKRRYKLALIILMGIVFTYIIDHEVQETKINIVAIGDSLAIGMTAYDVVGTSFNDYLKEYYEEKHLLGTYNNEFSKSHLSINEINSAIEKNQQGNRTHIPIEQTIASASILTLSIGLDELIDYSFHSEITQEVITDFISSYHNLLAKIRTFYHHKIIIIGLYPGYNLEKSAVVELNKQLSKLAVEYKAKYLDILAIADNSNYYLSPTSYHLSYKAHQAIYEEILEIINEK